MAVIKKKTSDELHLTKLRLMVKATGIGLWDMGMVDGDPSDPDNEFNFSDEFRQMLGFESEEDFPNVFRSQVDRIHPDDAESVLEAYRQHVRDYTGRTPYDLEFRMFKKNGEIGYYRDVGETMRDEDGNALHTSGALMDVTEKWVEKYEKDLRMTKIQLMVKAIGIGMWDMDMLYDEEGSPYMEFVFSQIFRNILGYTDERDFPNDMESFTRIMHPDDTGYAITALDAHLWDKTGATPFSVEIRVKQKNGGYLYIQDTAETMRDEQGNPVHTTGAMRDISDFVKLIRELDAQRQEAEAANVAKSSFLSTMSHEIRTPMNAILGITEIQLQRDELDAGTKDALEKIYTSGDLLLSIINDILDLSKIEAGKLEIHDTQYEIASLLSDTCQLNMMRIGSKEIEFELLLGDDLPTFLVGDELRIKQILNNLLSNAFKYTDKGKVQLIVSALPAELPERETLSICVTDTGQGMTKEQVDVLFEEYTRFNAEANRTTEGTGLGMNITRNLVKLMGGEISVESESGKGSRFTVALPQLRCTEDRLSKESADNLKKFRTESRMQMRRVQVTREPMPYGKVLIVDDVETNIFVAKGLMTQYQLSIDSANSGFSALEKIEAGNAYDIVFMDHMMPKMDGVETTRRLREMGYAGTIVALTANAVAGQDKVFLESGFDEFISKPIDVRQLNKVLNTFVRDRHPEEAAAAREKAAKAGGAEDSGKGAKDAIDPFLAGLFVKDAGNALAVIKGALEAGLSADAENLRAYTIHMHGLRGALANIGKAALSARAKELEDRSRDPANTGLLEAGTPAFLEELGRLVAELAAGLPGGGDSQEEDAPDEDPEFLRGALAAISAACDEYDDMAIEERLESLKAKKWSKKTSALIGEIAEQLILSGFDEIKAALEKLGPDSA